MIPGPVQAVEGAGQRRDRHHDQEGERMLRHGCLAYLQKPYNIESLNQIVRNVLDSGL